MYDIKTNTDYGTSTIVQDAAIEALTNCDEEIKGITGSYQRRRDFMIEGFSKLGWDLKKTTATMYLWLKVPGGYDSKTWCKQVLDRQALCLLRNPLW
jgi:LL-diaminopimelate aminotransferase